jgi:predicted TIM-barrel fold metal-dependent hydrolase
VTEPALIDTHVHLWDKSIDGLHWPFLEPGFTRGTLHGTEQLDRPSFLPPDLWPEMEGCDVLGFVHVQAVGAIDDPSLESRWLAEVADRHGAPVAIVGSCYLWLPDAPALLRRHAEHDIVRGVRDLTAVERLDADDAAAALDVCASLGYSVEVRRRVDDVRPIAEIAARWPEVTLVLSHACFPPSRTPADRDLWLAALESLAAFPNVVCKISAAAGSADPHWTVDSIRPWVLGAVVTFGADRCMFGSNWPIDRLYGTYASVIAAYREITAHLPDRDRAALFHATARRVYRIV